MKGKNYSHNPEDGVKHSSVIGKIIKGILGVILIMLIAFGAFLLIGTLKEWKPELIEKAEIETNSLKDRDKPEKGMVKPNTSYTLLSYNIGYAGLDAGQDFFMDGGVGVMPSDKTTVENNLKGILGQVKDANPDFLLMQEVDRKSKRSYKIDERVFFDDTLGGNSAYVDNYKSFYVPYPLKKPIGAVRGGLYTNTSLDFTGAERISLPVPFNWPVRLFNLKRCLLVTEFPIENSDKKLVIINVHMEAYDDGEGKTAQTEALVEYAKKEYEAGNYIIAAGDWNQSFFQDNEKLAPPKNKDLWQPSKLTIPKDLSQWKLVFDKNVPSCRLNNQPYDAISDTTYYFAIDGGLVSPNVKIEQVMNLDEAFKFSDHNPVMITFSLN